MTAPGRPGNGPEEHHLPDMDGLDLHDSRDGDCRRSLQRLAQSLQLLAAVSCSSSMTYLKPIFLAGGGAVAGFVDRAAIAM